MRALWLIPAILAIPVVAAIGLLAYANSQSGRHFIERQVEKQSGGTVRIAGLDGSLPGRIAVARVELLDPEGVWASAEDVALDWSPTALLRGKLSIRTLSARRVAELRPPVSPAGGSSGGGELPVRVSVQRLQIDRLDLAEPAASLTLSGSADLPSLWHSHADLLLKRLDGEGEYKLHLEDTQLDLEAEEPPQGLLSRLANLPDLGRLRLKASMAGPLEAEKIQFELTAGPLSGEGRGTADFKGRHLDLDIGIQSPAMAPRPDLSWKSARLEAHVHGGFDRPEAEGHLTIEGIASGGSGLDRVEAELQGKDGKLDLSARLIGLRVEGVPPKLLDRTPVEVTAETDLSGREQPVTFTLSHPLLQAQGKTALSQGAPISVEATVPDIAALAPLTGLDLHGRAALKGRREADGKLSVEGRIEQGRELLRVSAEGTVGDKIDLRWSAETPDVARLGAPVPGSLSAKGSLQGTPAQLHAAAEAQGRLAGAPLSLSLKIDHGSTTRIDLEKAHWKSVEAGGTFDLASGSLQARIGDLDDFSPFAGMKLSGSAQASLEMVRAKSPRAVIHADLRQIGWSGGALGHLQIEGSVEDPLGHPATALHLDAEQVETAGFTGKASLAAEGPENALRLSLSAEAQGPQGPASLTGETVADLAKKTLQLASLQAVYAGETAKLLAPASITFDGPVEVNRVRLGVGPAELDLDGQAAPRLALDLRLQKTELAAFQRYFPSFKVKGSVAGQAHLEGETAQIDLRFDSGKNGTLSLSGSAPLQEDGALDLSAKGTLNLALLEPLLAAEGREARGKVALDATVSGTMTAPVIAGGAELQGISLQDYGQGFHLSDIEGRLQADNGVLRLAGVSGKAGPGRFTLEGSIGVLQSGMPVDLAFTTRNARPLASDLLTATLDADLKLGGAVAKGLSLAGKVKVKRAEINIPENLPSTVATLKVTKKGAPPPPPETSGVTVALDVAVDAPEQIFVRGRGVDAEMGGKLQVGDTVDDPQIEGGFDLRRGTYSLVGQTMNVTRGRISFDGAGPSGKLDPALDMTIESASNGIDATLSVTGYADAPVLKLSSSPDLPQDEILARLLFNESVSQLTPLQLASIAQGVAQMSGVGGGFDPMAMVRKHLGIDRLSVTSSGADASGNTNTMVEAGKYVATGVYVGTRQGLNGGTQARVQIDLTRHLKLETQIGTGGGTPATGTTIDNDPGSSIGLTWQFDY